MSDKDTAETSHTFLVHDEQHAEGAVSPPIYQTSLFTFNSYEEMEARFKGLSDRARNPLDNPTVSALLQKPSRRLNGAGPSPAASANQKNAVLGLVRTGDRIVCVNHCYPDT